MINTGGLLFMPAHARHAVAQSEAQDLTFDVARSRLETIAEQLQSVLTQKLTAYLVDLSDGRDIGRYARGERKPHPGTQMKLRHLFSLVSPMLTKEDRDTVQVWFMGRNPELADQSPAKLLHQDFNKNFIRVRDAANKFLATGE
ncbi:hypothetical protein WDW86_05565 [Bdellovibrionota bacterium FG-2]